MPKATKPSSTQSLGKRILAAIRSVLERCKEVGEKIGYPGEGGERRFRGWLASDLLHQVLGWPTRNIQIGEIFDVLLFSDEYHALATIETKAPYHKASKKDRADFEGRLSGYPTLRTAYFTNGTEWERLEIVVSGAELRILERSQIDINEASPELTELFFAPLRYQSADQIPAGQVYQVNRDNPFISSTLSRLAADLDQTVADSAAFYTRLFFGLREGSAGQEARRVAAAVYSQWCGKSLRVTPETAVKTLKRSLKEDGANTLTITRSLVALGLEANAEVVEEIMSLAPARREEDDALAECLWPALAPSVEQLSAQTAHVVLARALLYRVGEDEKVFPRRLSGNALKTQLEAPTSTITGRKFPATDLLENVRAEMQTFLPTVYLQGEFDWWAVKPEKRILLNTGELSWLRQFDDVMERMNKLMLRRLSHYRFESVDVDIWRNIYENYLPEDERQRLGGFYTPEELVNLILDIDGYVPNQEGLCHLSYIDPACGSGAFVSTALGRLMAHLDREMQCHKEFTRKGQPDWAKAESRLKLIAERVHAIDIHPFASFLTTLNVLFMVLPLYAIARDKDPDFTIDLHVFSADGLEPPGKPGSQELLNWDHMNSRLQLQADSYERYRRIMDVKFDRVFGNPPWGGVLKGSLAPVYDTAKKKHFAGLFPAAANGKYDVYGLFMERALQLLKVGGRFALLTQGTFLDKEWAKELRKLLATKTRLDCIADLNPFGQLFFRRMNSPCITATTNTQAETDGICLCVMSHPPKDSLGAHPEERREKVVGTVREVLKTLSGKNRGQVLFASGARVQHQRLRETAADRWDLSGSPGSEEFPEGWLTAAELLEMRQGVTPGGCLDIFLIDKKEAKLLGLEDELVHRAIKSKQLERWRVQWKDRILFYPYHVKDKKSVPAFTILWKEIKDEKLKKRLIQLKIEDALDFDQQIDERETGIVKKSGINNDSVQDLLKHRISLGLIIYPKAAEYLIRHYEQLEGRVFKKKNIRAFNRRWYEYLWPRDAKIMLAKPRILCPRLIRTVRFVLDDSGYLSDDGCLMIQPTKKTGATWEGFAKKMNSVAGESLSKKQLLQYCLAFMNSSYAQERLVTGRRPTPKGSYAITEAFLKEIPIPSPSDRRTVKRIIELVDELERREFDLKDSREVEQMEQKLAGLVERALDAVSL